MKLSCRETHRLDLGPWYEGILHLQNNFAKQSINLPLYDCLGFSLSEAGPFCYHTSLKISPWSDLFLRSTHSSTEHPKGQDFALSCYLQEWQFLENYLELRTENFFSISRESPSQEFTHISVSMIQRANEVLPFSSGRQRNLFSRKDLST